MNDLVQKVDAARIDAVSRWADRKHGENGQSWVVTPGKEQREVEIRAAIAAVLDDLAEPSEEVASAGQDQMALEPYGPDGIWHAMLAAKRKELGL